MSRNDSSEDRFFMKRALRLAAKGAGRTSPNPMVGAVVVRGETTVAEGFHEFVGGPHAEVNALRQAGDKARGATLYVTLEPCNHQGRTPPCTRAVLDSGVATVVIGMEDPNPGVRGGGASFLRSHGLRVHAGILEKECRALNQPFIKHVTTGLPYVTLKAAVTLDGAIASSSGDSKWISNERSRKFAHHLRCISDGVLIGIGTALADDPLLSARIKRRPACRQPVRIVLDSRLRLPLESALVRTAAEFPLMVVCGRDAPPTREKALVDAGAEVMRLSSGKGGIHLPELLRALGSKGLCSLLVEGGATVLGAFLDNGLADDFHFFYAPKVLGDPAGTPMVRGRGRERMADAVPVFDVRVRRFGEDVMLSGRLTEHLY
ncbi:bifunctional diaminohydroxyphosphoribosylaminopyrimidine deaminase/5-amino-6-(5-phosphoribosylamino)uracil reductase RibD [Syntrophobacter fumaroxidans]|nr:bifunctional diaminohydroxyphosphoribosylaminopyrimidine deaminase/5-amino-6-(5-phosphoribosylamino)uracil reductase RibD [Syntrophobacter fumaroxidans]